MNQTVKAQWVEALRSGDYIQGQGRLALARNGQFCCLGVLCQLAANEGIIPQPYHFDNGDVSYVGETAWLPDEVLAWSGLETCNPGIRGEDGLLTLSGLNDSNVPFSEIADKIEKYL